MTVSTGYAPSVSARQRLKNNFAPYTRSLFYYLSIVEHMHNLIDAQKAIQSVDRRDRRGECGVCGRTIREGEEKRTEEEREELMWKSQVKDSPSTLMHIRFDSQAIGDHSVRLIARSTETDPVLRSKADERDTINATRGV
jgi:hypothetical protein